MRTKRAHHFSDTNLFSTIGGARRTQIHEIDASNGQNEQRNGAKQVNISNVTVHAELSGTVRAKMNVCYRPECEFNFIARCTKFLHRKLCPQSHASLWSGIFIHHQRELSVQLPIVCSCF